MKSKNKATATKTSKVAEKPATTPKPNGDGFYWLNDKNAYGWEVVNVSGNYLYRSGMAFKEKVDNVTYNEWMKLEKPE